MSYVTFELITDGAVSDFKVFTEGQEEESVNYIDEIKQQFADNAFIKVEIYKQYHGHPVPVEDWCTCGQYCDGDNNYYKPIWSNCGPE